MKLEPNQEEKKFVCKKTRFLLGFIITTFFSKNIIKKTKKEALK